MGIGDNHAVVTRRKLLAGAAMTLALSQTAQAGGGGGREPDGTASKKSSSGSKKPRKLDVIYTQRHLKRVSDEDLKTAIDANKSGGSVVVEGFSRTMSSKLFEMMLIDRDETVWLVQETGRAKSDEKRKTVLEESESRVRSDEYSATLTGATTFFSNDPVVKRQRRYLKLLKAWIRTPSEGAL